MKYSKLKPLYPGSIKTIIIVATVVLLSSIVFLRTIFTYDTKIIVFGIVWLIISLGNLIAWLMTRYLLNFTFTMIAITLGISYLSDYKGIYITFPLIILFLFYLYFLSRSRKYTSNYHQILELAAQPIDENRNGFTARPFPVGEANYSKTELSEFAKFLKKHVIALPYVDKTGIKLVLNEQSRFWFGKPNLQKDTYISFDFDGSIVVNIAKKEYQKYQDELSFDQLCEALGKLFIEFLELFKQGKSKRIIDRMNAQI